MPSVWILGLAGVLSTPDAALLHDELARLSTGVRVMYVAAHPDDEHSELLAYLVTGRHAQVAYLSLTRGDGGQNRIGSEQGAMLGVLRTQELLAARRIDRAEQLFTRALDFGYSKSAEETLEIWGEDEILGDVVYAIRSFRPHVIITRFPERGETHGHHLSSARLARRAFALAADPSAYPEQLEARDAAAVAIWQATRLVHDVPRFMRDTTPVVEGELTIDIGGFDPWRGRSFGEIAAESRSQHRSQGFGTMGRRGSTPIRFQPLEGTRARADLLEGIAGTWSELEGGAPIGRAVRAAWDAFDPARPERSVPALLAIRRSLGALPASPLRDELAAAVDALVVGCSGVFVDVRSSSAIVHPGASITLEVEALRRSEVPVRLASLAIDVEAPRESGATERRTIARDALPEPLELAASSSATPSIAVTLPADATPSVLPWLRAEPLRGRTRAEGRERILPWGEPSIGATVALEIGGERVIVRRAVRHVRADPVLGERAREVEIHPALLLTPSRPVALAAPGGSATLSFAARGAPGRYEVSLEAPAGWTVEPRAAIAELGEDGRGEVRFEVRAGESAAPGIVRPAWRRAGEPDGRGSAPSLEGALEGIGLDHPHVPERTVLLPATMRLVPVALRSLTDRRWRVGYVEGTGDAVAGSLAEAGMEVETLSLAALGGDLSRFDAIVIGVRAFNHAPSLHERHPALLAYAEAGGTVIVQYQTVNRLEALRAPIGPAPLRIDRSRVTDEAAAVELLAPEHPALSSPHRIGPADFEGWVQERGLYFAEEWDPAYVPLLRMADPGERPLDGALVVAPHGEGHFVYTGLSFFRQLPAGVPGAYRLFENLVALGRARAGAAEAAVTAPPSGEDDERAPLGSWRASYGLVAALLAALIALFYWLSRRYG